MNPPVPQLPYHFSTMEVFEDGRVMIFVYIHVKGQITAVMWVFKSTLLEFPPMEHLRLTIDDAPHYAGVPA